MLCITRLAYLYFTSLECKVFLALVYSVFECYYCDRAGVQSQCWLTTAAGVDSSKFKAGDVARFLLVFELWSDADPNYKHVHTLKGIAQHTLGPWTRYQPILCAPTPGDTEICSFDQAALSALNVRGSILRIVSSYRVTQHVFELSCSQRMLLPVSGSTLPCTALRFWVPAHCLLLSGLLNCR